MVRSVLGIEAFGINAWTATEDGQQLIVEHDEIGLGAGRHEELYVVVEGNARFTVDGEVVEAPAGTVVHIPIPTVRRSATADAGTTVLVIGGRRGEAFEVSSWERSAEALRFWPTEEWERAIAILQREHVEHPENAGVLYNLACAERPALAEPTTHSIISSSRSSSSRDSSKREGRPRPRLAARRRAVPRLAGPRSSRGRSAACIAG